jgi:hypothetical protein
VVVGASQELESPKVKRVRCEIIDDERGTLIAPGREIEIEGAIERWESGDIEVRAAIAHGVDVILGAFYPQVLKIHKLRDEIKDLLVISPREFQFEGL